MTQQERARIARERYRRLLAMPQEERLRVIDQESEVPPTDRTPAAGGVSEVPLGNNPAPFTTESVTLPETPDALKNE